MSRYIENALDKRYEVWKNKDYSEEPESMMDLAIADFMRDRPTSRNLDPEFKKWATIQIRTFFFAGHDSTAATIVYCLYLLSKGPGILAQVRAEHDQTFGADITTTAQQLKDRPELINQLPLTTAVIKEVLRLYPPASALRGGMPGVYLEDKNGHKFPTEGLLVWIVHGSIQRNPNYWPEPHSFIPDRWLVAQGHHLYPPKYAFRPFEAGPRDCVGQSLAMVDIKVALALTIREFDFHDQYAEWDRQHPNRSGPKTVFGERAYQVPQGAAHAVHGMPCRVVQRPQTGHL
ncbi:hypothetical protein N7478_002667 [Penicillium angulare]|uniref:uncharacterized protein n=1 Tax=Penicillium angulare TaxID=116970 RepID=UPI0025416117|nr:uncharacterized protein N7478_002667 [Penicillium angulare]KAJ5286981.1 hypothetical protein N7478_002667 [Penicillium angulare]